MGPRGLDKSTTDRSTDPPVSTVSVWTRGIRVTADVSRVSRSGRHGLLGGPTTRPLDGLDLRVEFRSHPGPWSWSGRGSKRVRLPRPVHRSQGFRVYFGERRW